MLALHHAVQTQEVAFRSVRADAVEAVGLGMIDAHRLEATMHVIPVRGFVA